MLGDDVAFYGRMTLLKDGREDRLTMPNGKVAHLRLWRRKHMAAAILRELRL